MFWSGQSNLSKKIREKYEKYEKYEKDTGVISLQLSNLWKLQSALLKVHLLFVFIIIWMNHSLVWLHHIMTFHTQLDASKYCCVVLLLPWFFETNKFVLLYNMPISVVKIVHVLSLVFASLILAPEKELEPHKGGEVTCDNRGLGVGKAHLPN